MNKNKLKVLSAFLVIFLLIFCCKKEEKPLDPKLESFTSLFNGLLKQERIAGAQLIVGQKGQILYEKTFGTLSVENNTLVNSKTLFCIGSCSKTFTGVIIMTLVTDGILELDAPIDRWLPQFADPQIAGVGTAERAPTVRELLCHRSGIYSQKRQLTEKQMGLIRDFSLTLKQSVDMIAKEELIYPPGSDYAYSGAAYCVLGRVAEVASGKMFEDLLQERICLPLDMNRTTYFPFLGEKNIALGHDSGEKGLVINNKTPHLLGSEHRFPLIGGSIYSTANETARFAQLVLYHGSIGSTKVLIEEGWLEMTSPQSEIPQPQAYYGLGWRLNFHEGEDRPWRIRHNGRLAGYNSMIRIYLDSGYFFVSNWTGPEPEPVREAIEEALARLTS